MGWLSILLIAIGLSVDSFAVCFGKGVCIKVFRPWRSCKIALVFGLFQGLMPLIGYGLSIGFSFWIQQFDHWLTFFILLALGVKMIYECYKPREQEDCTNCVCNELPGIDWRSVTALAFATSIDAAATGLIFASYPGTILPAILVIGVVSFLFSFFGISLGVHLGKRIHFCMEAVGGIILIGIGVKILLEHLLQGA
ncbi:MAG: manganese efflux pump MntP family protein [Proteiniphilum sp.]|jgi:putative Mn2+ efflux pump MntP|nr:manganese efflux pump MntP family protein [Proteiniphilum sp.]NCB24361.1 manganese efflux pump MntP family protein [Bacteroidia bacterium]MDD2937307.1 manganese efflux pump MntP family protein [Proteiniphilum sp.]MDD3075861.1 manganese efflux pump MntP family protein [Proteiniphilum sp.]MDD3779084.1 manganese efflux pump MntP family protein [Proteiniphilum sp.]